MDHSGTSVTRPTLNTRNAWCDCIRGYAIALVCVAHVLHVEPIHRAFGSVTRFYRGDTGVFLFYVLSGFLVTGILVRETGGETPFPGRARAMANFFIRRIFRLQPSYLLFLSFYLLVCARQEGELSWYFLLLPLSNWVGGPYVTWHIKTLHIEESYYACIGGVFGILGRATKPLLWALLIAAPLGRIVLFLSWKLGSVAALWLLDRYLPLEAFAVGGLLALELARLRDQRVLNAIYRRPRLAFIVAFAALLLVGALRDVKPFSYLLLTSWPLLFSLSAAVMIAVGIEVRSFLFGPEWLRRIGVVSYTIYLFQQLVLGPWEVNFGAQFSWVTWAVAIGLFAMLAPLWFGLVEKPLTDLGAWWFPRIAAGGEAAKVPYDPIRSGAVAR